MTRLFRGVYTALVTPFTAREDVDFGAYKRLVEFQIASGVDGLVPCGTTGESSTLSYEEHKQVVSMAVKQARGRVPVIAGSGSNSTREAVYLSQFAEECGADAVLLVNPYYLKPTQKGLYLHFSAIAQAVSIPCIPYNIKGRTAVNLENDTLLRLMEEHDNIAAVKEASGDIEQMRDLVKRRLDRFSVVSGDDNMTVDLIEAGGDGVISVASNLLPGPVCRMVKTALGGDIAGARRLEAELMPFFKACFTETNPIPIKTAMSMYGWAREVFRLPMCTFSSDEHYEVVREALAPITVPQAQDFS